MPIPQKGGPEKTESAKEKVYNQLLQWMIDGTLAPGEKLNESELADYFSVSRTPVHEALMLLAEEHFTEVAPSRGSFVSLISMEDADAVYEAISAIQCNIAVLACEKRTDAAVKTLRELNERFERAYSAGDIEQTLRTDNAFHTYVAEIAGNPYLQKYLRHLQQHVYRFEYILSRVGSDRTPSEQNHRELIAAIADGNKAVASMAAEENWIGQYRDERIVLERAIRENGWEKT